MLKPSETFYKVSIIQSESDVSVYFLKCLSKKHVLTSDSLSMVLNVYTEHRIEISHKLIYRSGDLTAHAQYIWNS